MKNATKHFSTYTFALVFLAVSAAVLGIAVQEISAAPPAGFELETVVGGLNLPTTVSFAPDGRIFVAEKSGAVRIVKDGALLSGAFIVLPDVNDYADHGLLGLAIDPAFETNGFVYLLYTHENSPADYTGPKTGRLVRVVAAGDTAIAGSEVVLMGSVGGTPQTPSCEDYDPTADCIPTDSPSHSVGGLRFGPDGKLYVSLGDGANFDFVDPLALRAQDLDRLAGKLLRINTDGTAPADNPFYNGDPTANRSKVWNLGLRNAFRFNFNPADGLPYLGDVGWFSWEEINKGTPGANFGWPCREGLDETPGYGCVVEGYTDPWYVYPHDIQTGAGSVTAGIFYSGTAYPATYAGDYFFGDFAINFLKRITVDAVGAPLSLEDFLDDPAGPVEIVLGPDGYIYYLSIYTGELRRITYTTGNRQPVATASSDVPGGLLPLAVQFSATGSSDPDGDPLTYAWDFGDSSSSTDTNPQHTYTVAGTYDVLLTVTDGNGGLATDTLAIVAGNAVPTADITSPASGAFYEPHEPVFLTGSGIDAEDGSLGGSDLVWTIILHHNTHIHILQQLEGTDVSFAGPDHDDFSVYLEIQLTVTDSAGLSDTTSIDMFLDAPVPLNGYRSEFYNNADATGIPVLVRSDVEIDFDWGLNSPSPLVNTDQFSARFSGEFNFVEGDHVFYVTGDDGVRLYLDGVLVLDAWVDQPATEYIVTEFLTPGIHRISLEYYDNLYNATVRLRFEKAPAPPNPDDISPQHVTTVVAPENPQVGEEVLFTTTVVNSGGAGDTLVDIEVFQNGVKVAQEFYDNEPFAAGETRDFTFAWTPTEEGSHRVAIGLIASGWGGVYEWTNEALTFLVGAGGTSELFSPTHLATVVEPAEVSIGEPALITATVTNTGAPGAALVDIEVYYNSEKVGQEFYDNEPFAAGEMRDFTFAFTPAQNGEYGIVIGLMEVGWGPVYEWNSHTAQLLVSDGAAPGPAVIYDDTLAPDWVSWSWETATDFAASFAQSGVASLAVTFTEIWGGLYLHHGGTSVGAAAILSLDISGGSAGGQQLQITAFGAANEALVPTPLIPYVSAGSLPAGTWEHLHIPLSDIAPGETTITGFAIQGTTGLVEPTFYIDNVELE